VKRTEIVDKKLCQMQVRKRLHAAYLTRTEGSMQIWISVDERFSALRRRSARLESLVLAATAVLETSDSALQKLKSTRTASPAHDCCLGCLLTYQRSRILSLAARAEDGKELRPRACSSVDDGLRKRDNILGTSRPRAPRTSPGDALPPSCSSAEKSPANKGCGY
jgi:hypothetical protein